MKIKTRFAPSPTGYLHVGGVRTALYSFLFSRHKCGKFLLRIEDSDLERSKKESLNTILEGMSWLNIDWDEGPYFQTKRFDRYRTVINEMLHQCTAYKCYCSKKYLEVLRKNNMAKSEQPRYDGYCRNRQCNYDELHVVRFGNPQKGSVFFQDKIYGIIKLYNNKFHDIIIRRTDGSPTYNLCVVVDDWDMKINQVIRGEDHINNAAIQINILKVLDAPIPKYAHVSIILREDGKKISKRHGAVSIMQYRDDGYLPESLLNYLVRLGWAYFDKEIFSFHEMRTLFTLEAINKSSSTLNTEKLQWLNHHYIKHIPREQVAVYLSWHIKNLCIDTRFGPSLPMIVHLLKKSCKNLKKIAQTCSYFYEYLIDFHTTLYKKYMLLDSFLPLKVVQKKLSEITNNWTLKNVHFAIHNASEELGISMSRVGMPLRVAVTGKEKSPGIYTTIHVIGPERTINRINNSLYYINENKYENN